MSSLIAFVKWYDSRAIKDLLWPFMAVDQRFELMGKLRQLLLNKVHSIINLRLMTMGRPPFSVYLIWVCQKAGLVIEFGFAVCTLFSQGFCFLFLPCLQIYIDDIPALSSSLCQQKHRLLTDCQISLFLNCFFPFLNRWQPVWDGHLSSSITSCGELLVKMPPRSLMTIMHFI